MKWTFFPEIESTQTHLKNTGAEPGTGIWTIHQTGGHGRGGRDWNSAAGNLAFSFCIEYDTTNPTAIPLIAGFSLREAILEFIPALEPNLKIKWPNDLLILNDDLAGKCSGLLVDRVENPSRYIVGIGINSSSAPKLDQPTAALPPSIIYEDPLVFLKKLIELVYKNLKLTPEEFSARSAQVLPLSGQNFSFLKQNEWVQAISRGIGPFGELIAESKNSSDLNSGLKYSLFNETIRLT